MPERIVAAFHGVAPLDARAAAGVGCTALPVQPEELSASIDPVTRAP
jgi:hypothetical protein